MPEHSSKEIDLNFLSLGEFIRVTPFMDYPMPGDKITYDDLSVSFLVDEDMTNYIELLDWMKKLGSTENPSEQYKTLVNDTSSNVLRGITSDCTLTILTNNMNANKSVVFQDCFPTTISEISFESIADDVSPITASATFKFRDYTIKAVT